MAHKKYHSTPMIQNDNSKIANMPQDSKISTYPYGEMLDTDYVDDLAGIDRQIAKNMSVLKKQFNPHKW